MLDCRYHQWLFISGSGNLFWEEFTPTHPIKYIQAGQGGRRFRLHTDLLRLHLGQMKGLLCPAQLQQLIFAFQLELTRPSNTVP